MSKRKKGIETTEDLINAIDDSLEEMVLNDLEEAQIHLREIGIDPISLGQRMAKQIASMADKSPLNWKNQQENLRQKQQRLDELARLRKNRSRKDNQQRFSILMKTVEGKPQRFATAYRNLDRIEDDDLDDMLDELEFLLIEQNQKNGEE